VTDNPADGTGTWVSTAPGRLRFFTGPLIRRPIHGILPRARGDRRLACQPAGEPPAATGWWPRSTLMIAEPSWGPPA